MTHKKSFLLRFLSFSFISPSLAWIAYKCQRVNAIHTYTRAHEFRGKASGPCMERNRHHRRYTVRMYRLLCVDDAPARYHHFKSINLRVSTLKYNRVRHANRWIPYSIQYIYIFVMAHGAMWIDNEIQRNRNRKVINHPNVFISFFAFHCFVPLSSIDSIPSPYSTTMCVCACVATQRTSNAIDWRSKWEIETAEERPQKTNLMNWFVSSRALFISYHKINGDRMRLHGTIAAACHSFPHQSDDDRVVVAPQQNHNNFYSSAA